MTAGRTVIPVVVGPTAVGKTEIAVRVAEHLGAEIISSDSRQIFRQMRIGTAVPDPHTLSRVPHHLIGELDVGDAYSAGIFADTARKRIDTILSRGKRVVVTGGSTLYLQALTEGLDAIPEVDPSIRTSLVERLNEEGPARLYRELADVDPVFAATLDETKSQRIVRGLEVFIGTGHPLSHYFNGSDTDGIIYDIAVLRRSRPILYDRINSRVDGMMSSGLLDEVGSVLEYATSRNIELPATIGYNELIPVLAGRRMLDEGIRLVKRNSRRYAKRQLTWYRSLETSVWYDLDEVHVDDIVGRIADRALDTHARTSQNA